MTQQETAKLDYYRRATCRGCSAGDLRPFLDLGSVALANSFLTSEDEFEYERRYPLDVHLCEQCSLVQLTVVVDPDTLFRNYIYLTGTSESIVAHNQSYAASVIKDASLANDDLVLEIASNNGNLLGCFRDRGFNVLGVEPAENIARIANDDGIDTLNRFFDSSAADDILSEFGHAKAVIANNVLAHVDEPIDFLRGCRKLLAPEGRLFVEVPYIGEFLDRVEYDTVYHEHLCYFSATSLLGLFDNAGLTITRIDRLKVHGGSLRIVAGDCESIPEHSDDVLALARDEKHRRITDPATYLHFSEEVEKARESLLSLLHSLRNEGKTIAGYGAPAKGNTLLNFCGIGTDLVEFTVDRNPLKVGTYTPGSHIPVMPVSELLARQPDYVLILAWNFAEEIVSQQREYLARGGRFIVPVPAPRIVEK